MSTPALLTEEEAAAAFRVCARTLRKERQAGRLSYILIGRCVRYDPSDLQAYIERLKTVDRAPVSKAAARKVGANQKSGVIVPFSQRSASR